MTEMNLISSNLCATREIRGFGGNVVEFYYNGIFVGERYVNADGEVEPFEFEEPSVPEPEYVCPFCGHVVVDHVDQLYRAEYPNSSDLWVSQQIAEHGRYCQHED